MKTWPLFALTVIHFHGPYSPYLKSRSAYWIHDTATPSVPADHFSEDPIVDPDYS